MEMIRKKMQTLRAKLEEANKEATTAEDELETINNKVKAKEHEMVEMLAELAHLEHQLDSVEDKSCDFSRQLSHTELSTEESRQARKILENRTRDDVKRVAELEGEREKLVKENEAVCAKLLRIQREVDENEQRVDEEEDRVDVFQSRVKELEMGSTQTGNLLRSMEVSEQQGMERVTTKSEKIEEIKELTQLKKKEALAAETLYDSKCQAVDAKERELEEIKAKHEGLKKDLDTLVAEIAEL